jgi:hypothetical protein
MVVLYSVALVVVFMLPSLLSLTPDGYDLLPAAHLLTFLLAVILFVWLGRRRGLCGRPAGRTGLIVGAVAGALGALGTTWVMHTPPATAAFVRYLAARGVPPAAAVTMHNLHLVTTTALTALMAGGFYAVVGAFAAWWGARPFRGHGDERRPVKPVREDPST